jgi:hypothetical protein
LASGLPIDQTPPDTAEEKDNRPCNKLGIFFETPCRLRSAPRIVLCSPNFPRALAQSADLPGQLPIIFNLNKKKEIKFSELPCYL